MNSSIRVKRECLDGILYYKATINCEGLDCKTIDCPKEPVCFSGNTAEEVIKKAEQQIGKCDKKELIADVPE